jgi:alanine dehydrogenase
MSLMEPGSVAVDIAIDQGGCFETARPTTHAEPVYVEEGVNHYCVANIPGAVPMTSTEALTNATLPYAVEIANKGWKQACLDNGGLREGLNVVDGTVTNEAVAAAFDMSFSKPLDWIQNHREVLI